MEILLGGAAAIGACVFTNPMDVVKTRMQLQGELRARGQYSVHYRNVVHAVFAIAKADGLIALQKGLAPSLCHQFLMNGIRLGAYRFAEIQGWTVNRTGNTTLTRSLIFGAGAGLLGAVAGSPMYLVKIHLQSQATSKVAVGYQHNHGGMVSALKSIYSQHGLRGLWRGVISALPRTAVGSAAQLSTFSLWLEYLKKSKIISDNAQVNTIIASMASSVAVVLWMSPFDVVSTRLYNQGVNAKGNGLLYSGVADCFMKIWKTEGVFGFFKGLGPNYFRVGPHVILCLFFWEELKTWQRQKC